MLISQRPHLRPIPHDWEPDLLKFELFLRAQGRTATTIDTRIRHLRTLARQCGERNPESVTSDTLVTWSGSKNWAPETRNSYHASVRLFFQWRSERYGTKDPSLLLKSVRRPVPPPRPAPDTAIRKALATRSQRLTLILRLAAELGLRSAEIASIAAADIHPAEDGWGTLTVHGKGRKARMLPVPPDLMIMITKQSQGQKWLFPGNVHGHLSPKWIGKLAARSLPGQWTLHTLRHRGPDPLVVDTLKPAFRWGSEVPFHHATQDLHRAVQA
ncbi:tyrosine-type recombinase/integrase [Corynebacterium mayonis]|uniref:tyrosine-type recombinase/integrase n=1 Tax=Corynebacterium mayonis TaxID=3062461 RepID=UPI003CC7F5B4